MQDSNAQLQHGLSETPFLSYPSDSHDEHRVTHFVYVPYEKYTDVSSKPRLYERPNTSWHREANTARHVTAATSRRITPVTPVTPYKTQQQLATSSITARALQSHMDDTLSLKEKEEWINNRFHPDHWTMFDACNPRHPSYYAENRQNQRASTAPPVGRPFQYLEHGQEGATSWRSSGSPPATAPSGNGRRSVFPISRKHVVYPMYMSNRLEMVDQRPLLSARPVGTKYSVNPRWSSNCYGLNTIR